MVAARVIPSKASQNVKPGELPGTRPTGLTLSEPLSPASTAEAARPVTSPAAPGVP
jgi:hypothetical protein